MQCPDQQITEKSFTIHDGRNVIGNVVTYVCLGGHSDEDVLCRMTDAVNDHEHSLDNAVQASTFNDDTDGFTGIGLSRQTVDGDVTRNIPNSSNDEQRDHNVGTQRQGPDGQT